MTIENHTGEIINNKTNAIKATIPDSDEIRDNHDKMDKEISSHLTTTISNLDKLKDNQDEMDKKISSVMTNITNMETNIIHSMTKVSDFTMDETKRNIIKDIETLSIIRNSKLDNMNIIKNMISTILKTLCMILIIPIFIYFFSTDLIPKNVLMIILIVISVCSLLGIFTLFVFHTYEKKIFESSLAEYINFTKTNIDKMHGFNEMTIEEKAKVIQEVYGFVSRYVFGVDYDKGFK